MADLPLPWKKSILSLLRPPWPYYLLSAILAPIAIFSKIFHFHSLAIFFLNLLSWIPTAALFRQSIQDLVLWFQLRPPRVPYAHTCAGLLDCLFGCDRPLTYTSCPLTCFRNGPELIFAITALLQNETTIVQTAITGSVLSSSLFVLGICFVIGGWDRDIKEFPRAVVRANTQLLMIALGSLVLPIAYESWSEGKLLHVLCLSAAKQSSAGKQHSDALSRATAVVLLCLYGCYFWFFFGTHAYLLKDRHATVTRMAVIPGLIASSLTTPSLADETTKHAKERLGERILRPLVSLGVAVATAAILTISCIFTVEVIDAPYKYCHISRSFTGLIILPLFLSATESVIAAIHAHRQEMDEVIQRTIGANIQNELFVLPSTVSIAAFVGIPMTIFFDGFQVALVWLSVFLINLIFQEGDGQW